MNLNEPLIFRLYDPNSKKTIRKIVVFFTAGDRKLKKAISAIEEKSLSEGDIAVLKSHYGADWKRKLALGVTGGVDTTTAADEIILSSFDYLETDEIQQRTGADDFDESDIANLLEFEKHEKPPVIIALSSGSFLPAVTEAGTDYYEIPIYEDDTIFLVKMKLAKLINIPYYRIHFGWFDSEAKYVTPYRISLGAPVKVNIDNYSRDVADKIYGINIDMNAYRERSNLIVRPYEQFMLASELMGKDLILVDLNLFIGKLKMRVSELSTDKHQFNMLYYGFIVLYWPHMTHDAFAGYLAGERDFLSIFPDMTIEDNGQFDAQSSIISLVKNASSVSIVKTITSVYYYVENTGCSPKVRNIFDSLVLNNEIFFARVSIDVNNFVYLVDKKFTMTKAPTIPNIAIFKHGVIIAINTSIAIDIEATLLVHILQNGRYYIKVSWPDSENMEFERSNSLILRVLKPFFKFLDNPLFYIGSGRLKLPRADNIHYQSVNANYTWQNVVTENEFQSVRAILDNWTRAGMLSFKSSERGVFDIVWSYGVYKFDHSVIEKVMQNVSAEPLVNYYGFLSSQTLKQKWVQNYGGRSVKLVHRTSDIRFEFNSIKEDEFIKIEKYVKVLMLQFSRMLKGIERKPSSQKKLKKLKELDPLLYDIKRMGATKVYSIKCQSERQPNLFTDSEVASMGAKDRAQLIKYWNFTHNRDAFYSCSKEFPHLSFIVGVHPHGYCLPCCKKSEIKTDTRREEISKTCLAKHKWSEEGRLSNKHIIKFGKFVAVDRFSNITNMITELLKGSGSSGNDSTATNVYVLAGVEQSNAIVNCLTYSYGVDSGLIKKSIAESVKQNINFDSILDGKILEFFTDKQHFIHTISGTVNEHGISPMNNILFEVVAGTGMGIIMFTSSADGTINMFVNTKRAKKYTIVVAFHTDETADNYSIEPIKGMAIYPVINITKGNSGNFVINKKLFDRDDKLITSLMKIYDENTESVDTTMLIQSVTEKIKTQYVGKLGKVYAVETVAGKVLPIDYDIPVEGISVQSAVVATATNVTTTVITTHGDRKFTIAGADTADYKLSKSVLDGGSVGAISEKISKLAALGHYKSRIYELFLTKLFLLFEEDRNVELRQKILKAVGADNSVIAELLSQYADDLTIVNEMLFGYYFGDIDLKEFTEQFNAKVFSFDRKSIIELREGRKNIRNIVADLCVEKTFSADEFPNTYDACLPQFCIDGKLAVDPSVGIDQLCAIFETDLHNGNRLDYLIESIVSRNIVDQFKFRRSREEVLSIKRI
jgi:hypothetical protein